MAKTVPQGGGRGVRRPRSTRNNGKGDAAKLQEVWEQLLEPLCAFLATNRPFGEVLRLAVVSPNCRTVVLKSLKTVTQLNLSRFAESVWDGDVRLALERVASENLQRVDLRGCHNISTGGMEYILQYMTETCSGVKEVDVTACRNEAVLRAVATRARAALGAPSALDLFALLRSLGEQGMRYSFSKLCSLLQASLHAPVLLLDPELDPRENALFQGAANGNGSDMAMLLSLSFAGGRRLYTTYDVNKKDSKGNSPLLLACRSGNLEIAEMLVVAGASVNAAHYRGDTPLLAAVGAGKLELAEMLVSKGNADVNVTNGGGASALHLVVASNNARSSETFETLLKAKGVDVNKKDSKGNSPLLLACRSGNLKIAEMLVVAGASVNAAHYRGDTPLLVTVGAGKLELAENNARSFEMFETLLKAGADVNVVRRDGQSALQLAIVSDNARSFEMFEALLKAGADVNVVRRDGQSALQLAIVSDNARSFEMFEALLESKADVNVINGDGASALHLVIASGNARILNCRDGASALHLVIASDKGRDFEDAQKRLAQKMFEMWDFEDAQEMFDTLLKAGAHGNVVRDDKTSALQVAIVSGKGRSFEMFEALLESKADVNVINSDGASALHLAVASDSARSFEMFETLLKAGADVNVVRRDGASVLALAIVSNNARILNCRMMSKMIKYDKSAEISYVLRLSLAFLEPNNIFRWLKDGRSPRELLGVVCALMASAETERPMQDRLSHVRAFINCNIDLLQDRKPLAPLTVTDVFKQLVLQESDSVFDSKKPDSVFDWNPSIKRGVVWVNKPPVQDVCGWTIQADGEVRSVAYSADGSSLARAEGNDVVVCDGVGGFEVHRCKSTSGHSDRITSVAWRPDGRTLASGSADKTIKVWKAKTGECQLTLSGHNDTVWSVCFSPCGTKIVSGGGGDTGWWGDTMAVRDFSIRIWDAETGTQIGFVGSPLGHREDNPNCTCWKFGLSSWRSGFEAKLSCPVSAHTGQVLSLCFDHTGKKLASGGGSTDSSVRLWSTESGAPIGSPLKLHSLLTSVAWNNDRSKLATLSNAIVQVWSVDWAGTFEFQWRLQHSRDNEVWAGHFEYQWRLQQSRDNDVLSVAWNNDGTKLVIGNLRAVDSANTVQVWSVGSADTSKCQSTLTVDSAVCSVAFSPDGSKIAAGHFKKIQLFDAQEQETLRLDTYNVSKVNCVSFSPDGKIFAAGCSDGEILLLDAVTATVNVDAVTATLTGHSNVVNGVWFSPNGSKLVSFSDDMSFKIWNLITRKCVSTRKSRSVTKLEYVDEKTLVTSSADGTMRVWSVDNGSPLGKLDGGSFAFSKDTSLEQKVVKYTLEQKLVKYSITFKDNLLLISEGQSVVAFFRAHHNVSCVGSDGKKIAVLCENGEVMQVRADWLV